MLGDKWTMLVVRELASGPKRTMELLNSLFPISSRTLVARLRDMENDNFIDRTDFGGNPPHIEYALTQRGFLLLPLLDSYTAVLCMPVYARHRSFAYRPAWPGTEIARFFRDRLTLCLGADSDSLRKARTPRLCVDSADDRALRG